MNIHPGIQCFSPNNVVNGYTRPYSKPNAWIPSNADGKSQLRFTWDKMQVISSIRIFFDNDFDHPMESSQMGHFENVIPFCIRNFKIFSEDKHLYSAVDNYQTVNVVRFSSAVVTSEIMILFDAPSADVAAGVFEVIFE